MEEQTEAGTERSGAGWSARLRSLGASLKDNSYRLIMVGVLRPAARVLPIRMALALADTIGWALALLPPGRAARAAYQLAFPDGPTPPAVIARRWLARPFRDYVALRVVVIGRLQVLPESRVELPESTRELFESGQSFILATGHFSREASRVLYGAGGCPRRLFVVVAPVPEADSAYSARMNVQFGQMVEVVPYLRSDSVLVTHGSAAGAREMVEHLRQPGWAPLINTDAPLASVTDLTMSRPFVGWDKRPVATGTAQLARMAQAPIALCIPYIDAEGTTVLRWSEVIPPPARRDRDADVKITNQLLDDIEHAAGEFPDQYVLQIGWGRRWDPAADRWVALDDGAGA